jgi:6-phosphogluconolactonase/glucosamine-6-phosphate isomerase/deaminase
MEMNGILAEIDTEIRKLEQARAILAGNDGHLASNGPAAGRKKRRLSPEARARIAAAQKARWAKFKKASK